MENELSETSNYQVISQQKPLEAGGLNRVSEVEMTGIELEIEVEMTGIELERSCQLS